MKTGLITGVTGQTGSHLADYLLSLGYKVVGVSRRRSGGGDWRIRHLYDNPNFVLEYGDVTDPCSLSGIVKKHIPDEIYALAAQSFVGLSWSQPLNTLIATAAGTLNTLDAVRMHAPNARVVHAASSEMFGAVLETPQKETTPFRPRSPYGVAKLAAYEMVRVYRASYGMFASNMIGFNHEGTRRGLEFVTRKITDGVARIAKAGDGTLKLGNLDAMRDWSDARDFARGYHLIANHSEPDDFVFSSQETHSIREFLEIAFGSVGLNWQNHVIVDKDLFRPAEVDLLLGDSSKARCILGWRPEVSFKQLVEEMVKADIERVQHEQG